MSDHGDATSTGRGTYVSAEGKASNAAGASTGGWADPGLVTIALGVHRVPLPLPTDGLRAVNVYVLEDVDGLVLIDGGWALAESRQALAAALATLGCELGDIRHFLVTHVHRDHYTQAVELRRIFGSKVSLGAGEHPAIRAVLADGARPFGPQLRQLRVSGAEVVIERLRAMGAAPRSRPPGWEEPDEWLAPGQEIELNSRTLRVVPTPGHTQGHVVFTDPAAGLLFAGDHVLPHITPSIGFEPVSASLPLGDYLESLRVVRALPDMRLLPAHGPVTPSVHVRVDELITHHHDRLALCAEAVAAGAGTAYQVACALRWTRRGRHLEELDPFNQMLAVTETRAHLELLAAQGRLTVSLDGEVALYAPPGGLTRP
jgi:glyoxylase-like metal-dependent hydrolase (beta-lactamase superfamily II)